MKLDLMVYGRGVERLEGYQLFAAPPYWSEQMLLFLSDFNELWSAVNRKDADQAAFDAEANPWAKTYMFICLPPPYCCALLRCTRVEGDTPGTWLKEVRQHDIWSMEGLCCPFEQRDQFFAMLPSILLWLEQDSTALYGRLRRGTIGTSVELPDTVIVNPYSDTPVPQELYSIMAREQTKDAWGALCQQIYLSSQPFSFLFGPLANYFAGKIAEQYGIQTIFSTLDSAIEPNSANDPFNKLETISRRQQVRETHTYHLRFRYGENAGKEPQRCWGIYEQKDGTPAEDILNSPWKTLSSEHGIRMLDLIAEAEAIRDFAGQMGWVVSDSAKSHLRFTFEKEE